jgi:hypothetical protein
MEASGMTKPSKTAILGAAAKSIGLALFASAGYCQTRAYVNVERFERELFSAARQWRVVHQNLKGERGKHGRKES